MKILLLIVFALNLFLSGNILNAQNNNEFRKKLKLKIAGSENFKEWVKPVENPPTKSAQYEPVSDADSLALIDLYRNAVGDDAEEVLSKLVEHNVQFWSGVELENGRVVSIEFVGRNMNGTIPSTIGELTGLRTLVLAENDLQGTIPPEIGNLTLLTNLALQENNLSGNIPSEIGNLTNLKGDTIHIGPLVASYGALDLSENNLTGYIPPEIGNLNKLLVMDLSMNNLSGNIPPQLGNCSQLINLSIDGNFLTGEIPPQLGNLSKMQGFSAGDNLLSGKIPEQLFSSGTIMLLLLANNNLSGELPTSISKPDFGYLILSGNDFSDIPEISISDEMPPEFGGTIVALDSNRFDFGDLEQFTQKDLTIFTYAPQDSVLLESITADEETELTMNVGGTQNTYEWYYNGVKITGETNKSFKIHRDTDVNDYYCWARNNLLPDLLLKGVPPSKEKNCWESGPFIFCLKMGTWEKGQNNNEITTSNQISINNFLNFEGTMTIDTAALKLQANGEFYVQDIPIPGGSIGKYTLSSGQYNLTLLGSDGKITNFVNEQLDKSPEIFGIGLNLNNLELVGGRNASGIKIGCTVKIPGISGGCENPDETDTEIKLEGLEITSKGLTLAGAQIKDLGLFVDGYCLKNLVYSYDLQKDIFISGMQLALPFGEVGGGFKLEEGLIDSIAWNIEASVAPFVLGSTTIGIKGFFGHISNITKPAIEVELGGIFSDIISDDLYRITASGRTVWPTEFEVKGTGQFLRPILNDFPFQLMGNVALNYDIPNELFKINFGGNFGTTDQKTWLIEGGGNFKICHRYDPAKFAGGVDGTISLPKFSDAYPYNWINTMFTFPVNMKTVNRFIWGKNKVVYGTSSFQSAEYGPYTLKYVVDLEKTWEDEDYIVYSMDVEQTKSAIIGEKSALIADNFTHTFEVPEKTEYGVIEITSEGEVPNSSILAPSGKTYSQSSSTDNVLYTASENEKEAFWTFFAPEAGEWKITLENPASNDSITTHFQLKNPDFKFSINQVGNSINVSWDVSQVKEGQTINIFFDDDKNDFDGFLVAEGDANLGSMSFSLDETTPSCNYYLFAQLVDEYEVIEAYADEVVENPLASSASPTNFNSTYISETGDFEFEWDGSPSSDITGYILSITDGQGRDSVYAILNSNQTSISLFIEDFEDKTAKIESYDQDWKIGCPGVIKNLTTSIDDNFEINEPKDKLQVYPNPTAGKLTIRYFVSEDSKCEIRVFDIQGRQIAQPLSEFKPEGFHELDFQYNAIPNGIYILKYVNNSQSITVKSVLSR